MNRDMIKKRQRWVADHPCRIAEECALPGCILDLERPGGLIVRTVLTIDLFRPPVAWRAQIGLLYPSRLPRARADWSIEESIEALRIAREMLAGVGLQGNSFLLTDPLSFELCYPLTSWETEHVSRASLRPAVEFAAAPIGEINQYDFTDHSTKIDGWWNGKTGTEEGIYVPKKRTILYEPGKSTNQ